MGGHAVVGSAENSAELRSWQPLMKSQMSRGEKSGMEQWRIACAAMPGERTLPPAKGLVIGVVAVWIASE